jgi:hypothetical protein
MERHMRHDPGQARSYAVWKSLLKLEPQEIAQRLLADTPEGAFLRETRPVFVVLSPSERREALESVGQLGNID